MPAETVKHFEALEASAQTLLGAFTRGGYEAVTPAIIQPAGVFLDVVGESLRARTYVFSDPDGDELCMRPDLTVPACRLHLERHPSADVTAKYCYDGLAFRFQPLGSGLAHTREFRQTGIEAFGEANRERADAEVVTTIAAGLEAAGLANYQLRFGDLGLLRAILKAADMPPRWRQRLMHLFVRPKAFKAELARLTVEPGAASANIPPQLRDALDPGDPEGAEAAVASYLETKGIEHIGLRDASEIAASLLGRVADARSEPLSAKTAQLIASYVAIVAPARASVRRIRELATLMGIQIEEAVGAYEWRLELMAQAGLDLERAEFSADFGRALAYYTGFVFEVVTPGLGHRSPVAGGGRYDHLLKAVGAPVDVPAVGAAVHTDRLVTALANGGAALANGGAHS
ncbi:ATP phosphoribosyltransferase regulatory subunit [Hyphomicrobium sp.]|uniref:ATP phosphoribosyltransferase regulatory subunit n=1 Tax=Hyphomicrobium sp. TaxID=82 RepID=UPI003F71AF2D